MLTFVPGIKTHSSARLVRQHGYQAYQHFQSHISPVTPLERTRRTGDSNTTEMICSYSYMYCDSSAFSNNAKSMNKHVWDSVSQCNDVAGILYLNDGIHQRVEQRDDEFARVPSLRLQRKRTVSERHSSPSTDDRLTTVRCYWRWLFDNRSKEISFLNSKICRFCVLI